MRILTNDDSFMGRLLLLEQDDGRECQWFALLAEPDADKPAQAPRVGERMRFTHTGVDEEVVILDALHGFTGFVSATLGVVIVDLDGRPAVGALEPIGDAVAAAPAPPLPVPHEAITLDGWRPRIAASNFGPVPPRA